MSGVETLAEFDHEKVIVGLLALIATGGKQTTLSQKEAIEILRASALNRQIPLGDRVDAIRMHSRWLGYTLSEGELWAALSALVNDGTGNE
jgi:hypothetical protein